MDIMRLHICVLSLFIYSVCAQGAHNSQSLPSPANVVPPINQNEVQNPSVKTGDDDIINLSVHPACRGDVQRLCGADRQGGVNNSLNVLECFLNHEDQAVTAECHQVIWQFKKDITNDKRIADLAATQCASDLDDGLKECQKDQQGSVGHFISCVVEAKDHIKVEDCRTFVNKLAVVVFSDYRLTGKFAEACEADIKRLNCGFVNNRLDQSHSQGAVINCLLRKVQEEQQLRYRAEQAKDQEAQKLLSQLTPIDSKCSHQAMRLMELQSDDFHLDRALFLACRDDRERFCHSVVSGSGRVYQCLQSKINEVTSECKEQLLLREKAAQIDYKVDYGLGQVCQQEVQQHQCVPSPSESPEVGMSVVILCLEGVIHQKGIEQISAPCLQAMQYQREAMMADYSISPNIVVFCKEDMVQHCQKVHPKTMLHCLMNVAQTNKKVGEGENARLESIISPQCGRELQQLLLTVDVAANPKIDPILYEACANIIETSCSRTPTSAHLMGCLMQHMHLKDMTENCERHLLETHYFVTRDIRLDAEVFDACRNEAQNLCNLKDDWTIRRKDQVPESGPMTFSCLFRHAFNLGVDNGRGMSKACVDQLQTTMHQRAKAMDLPPGVDVQCIHDLAFFCTDPTNPIQKGQEFICLQKNYAELQVPCKAAVQHFTQAIDKDIKLSVTYQNCGSMLEKFCSERLTKDSTFDDAMQCLIPHQEDPQMAPKCKAEIEHYELISMQQYELNIKFKEACRNDVESYCKGIQDLGEIVLCLSSRNREDIVNDRAPTISDACRRQLRSDLLMRAEHPEMDPLIKKNCGEDIKSKCPAGVSVENVLECLRGKVKELSSRCHRTLFKIEQVQAVDQRADSGLVKACRRAIEKYCRDEEDDKVLECLVEAKNEKLDMDPKCAKIILARQVEEAKDIRLNPLLFKDCKQDAQKFCPGPLNEILIREEESESYEHKLIVCLKEARKAQRALSDSCNNRLTIMARDVAMYFKLDPHLADVCHNDIKDNCAAKVKDQDAGKGEVMECLKSLLRDGKLRNRECQQAVTGIVSEGKADIHVDPILYSTCQSDLHKLCHNIQPGEGRQFQCLADELEEGGKNKLTPKCAKLLGERLKLIEYAAKLSAPETVEELVEIVTVSRSRHYLLAVFGGVALAVLVIGICCGRVTKRVRRELKNR